VLQNEKTNPEVLFASRENSDYKKRKILLSRKGCFKKKGKILRVIVKKN
jgi:hypothetical protein